ncbi:glycosyl transferase group 1 (plasmid) [halophilic archaeon DL31]|nr:glycosyl transferase group 1 [halophilic archaeon DL31]
MSTRVLQMTPSYPPVVGGIEDHVANLVERLPEHGYEPVVLTPDRNGVGHDDKVYRERPLLSVYKSTFAPGLLHRLFTLEYDLIHVHAPFHFGLEFAALASKVRSIPLIITAHMYDARDNTLYNLYESEVYDRCLDIADRIVPTTLDYVDGYDVFQRNVERVTPVPLGVDTDHYRPVRGARERLGWNDDENVCLFVGAMERHHFYKDVDLLIEAVARTDAVDRLVLVGSGDRVSDLQQKARREGVENSVDFPGYVTDESLPAYYSAADLFVLPSKADRGEAFGIVLLEAMACGTPVVTTDIPGVRTVVGDGGVIVPPGDRAQLIDGIERGLTTEWSPRNYMIDRYSLDNTIEEIATIYDEFNQYI